MARHIDHVGEKGRYRVFFIVLSGPGIPITAKRKGIVHGILLCEIPKSCQWPENPWKYEVFLIKNFSCTWVFKKKQAGIKSIPGRPIFPLYCRLLNTVKNNYGN
jgi:hypothetical protein